LCVLSWVLLIVGLEIESVLISIDKINLSFKVLLFLNNLIRISTHFP